MNYYIIERKKKKMKIIINLLSLIGVIIFAIKRINAEDIEYSNEIQNIKSNNNSNNVKIEKDKFYMIFVNNTLNGDGSYSKRDNEGDDIYQLINLMTSEINDIIIDNKLTYENITKLEEFEQKNILIEKRNIIRRRSKEENNKRKRYRNRNNKKKRNKNENTSNLAYPISTLNDKTIIYSFLSKAVVEIIEKLPYVMACVPDVKLFPASGTKGNLKKLQQETQWRGVKIRESSDIHLSVISQGKYDDQLIGEYDQNYYYPSSAGSDVDVFIIDNGFNFKHAEFANKDERITKCVFKVDNAKVVESDDDEECEKSNSYHGEKIADVVGGLVHGVAPKANIYGIAMEEESEESGSIEEPEDPSEYSEICVILLSYFIAALQQIRDNLFRPYKAIFNFSYGIALDYFKENDKYIIDYWEEFINELANEGAIFVASAGNEAIQVDRDDKPFFYPCSYENVICVGAVDNYGKNAMFKLQDEMDEINRKLKSQFSTDLNKKSSELYMKYMSLKDELSKKYNTKIMSSSNYVKASFSNYGKKVDLHAPGFVRVEYLDKKGKNHTVVDVGTSYSSPIVVGVAATIISENPNMNFNTTTMREYLSNIAEKDIIKGISTENPNFFINNGKHTVFSKDNKYYGCGPRSGNKTCSKKLICTDEGYCVSENSSNDNSSSKKKKK